MKALTHTRPKGFDGLVLTDRHPKPEPGPDEVRIRLKAAGLNHRDLFVLDRHSPDDPPFVIGSDGAGVIDDHGENVPDLNKGEEVIINPGLYWEKQSDAPPDSFEVLGFPNDGTFAEYVTVPAACTAPKPSHLSWEESAALSLAGLTAYRALFTRGGVKENMNVFIPGIGGGVATTLLQFARAAGARVFVSSRSPYKRKEALELGAEMALDSSEDWNEALKGTKMDLVIESVGAATFNRSMDTLRKGGTIVSFGSSTGDELQINLRKFFYGQYNLHGSTMGSHEEFRGMLAFTEKHGIKPVMDSTFPLEQFREAFEKLKRGEQLGKISFTI
ncbi:zinc-binding dehydrogenase [Alteribacter natronophilus]|uniref:zinc-binding dehydrogenase n=1 Tax=Alteribacter natronophilus TaxID=2583810 RepID=UPI00110D4CBE|nr:zinc-binding dehydrogenase [Alteribacter natronophilus]TMW72966.1 zinc-binding dehydrogenase [Alteribacter natronophilus]